VQTGRQVDGAGRIQTLDLRRQPSRECGNRLPQLKIDEPGRQVDGRRRRVILDGPGEQQWNAIEGGLRLLDDQMGLGQIGLEFVIERDIGATQRNVLERVKD